MQPKAWIRQKGNNLEEPEDTKKILESNIVDLNKEKWVQVSKIVRYIDEWNVQQLWICTKRKNDVIGILQEIRFNFLMILNLSHNFIETVEGINRVDAPILQTLSLRNNNFTHLKIIKKSSWPLLEVLGFSDNSVLQIQFTSLMHAPQLVQMDIEVQKSSAIQTNDIYPVIKMETSFFRGIWIRNPKRIKQKLQLFSKKHPNLILF